jgi:hypothetical protein
MSEQQTVRVPDITLDHRIRRDMYDATFVKSLVMTPLGAGPPVGALGVYWARCYAIRYEQIRLIETLAVVIGEGVRRRCMQKPDRA